MYTICSPDRQLFRGSAATIPGQRQKNDPQPRLGCQNIQSCYENDEKWMLTYLKLEIEWDILCVFNGFIMIYPLVIEASALENHHF